MNVGRQDRREVNVLHGLASGVGTVPRNLRNASGGASSPTDPSGPWRAKPTQVIPPTPGQRGRGNPFTPDSIRSSTKSHATRAPTLQNSRTVLSMSSDVKPGYEYSSARPNKRQKLDGRAPTGHMTRHSNHFKDGAAGRGGKAAKRGGAGPARSTRQNINLNKETPETIEVADSEEDREEVRQAERRTSKGKKKASSEEMDGQEENEIEVTSGPASRTPSYFDFQSKPSDGRSSGTPPATISQLHSSKAMNVSDDELDVIGDDEAPRANSAIARVEAALHNTSGPSSTRARTRAPTQPIAKQTTALSQVHADYISSDEEGAVEPPGKRTKSPNGTTFTTGNVQRLAAEYENRSSSSTSAPPPAPKKSQMQPKPKPSAQWGSSNERRLDAPTPMPNLDKKEELKRAGKIPKNKTVVTPADSDRIATSATTFATPNTRSHASAAPYASTSTSTESFDIPESPAEIEEVAPTARPAPTPISRPSGSRDDIRIMRLRHCAIGFKDLEISGADKYCLGLTRDFKKLHVFVERENNRREQLLEVNISKSSLSGASAVFGDKDIVLPFLQLRLGLSAIKGGSMSHYCDPGNARREEDSLILVPDKADPTWDQTYWEKKFLGEVRKINSGLGQIKNSGARQAWEGWSMKCQIAERADKHKSAENQASAPRAPMTRTLPAPDNGPRLPRVTKKKGPTSGKPAQLTLAQSMGMRRSARLSGNGTNDVTDSHAAPFDPDEVILVYPPSGRGSVNITNGDLSRLAPGDYLNDSLIEFGLKIWLDELRAQQPELADQIHVFSSFFYKKLGTNVEAGYASVRKWTSKIDIFEKKYLVIPINENFHWYLAIVYAPGRVLQPPAPSHTRQSTRLKGDKPDINLADSQSSVAQQQAALESGSAAATFADASAHNPNVAEEYLHESRTSMDMSEEMQVDLQLNIVTGGDSPLSDADLELVYPRSSSPEGHVDVDMEDASHEAGPSRAPSTAETLDDPTVVPDTNASKPPDVLAKDAAHATNRPVEAKSFYGTAVPRPTGKGKGRAEPEYMDPLDDDDGSAVTAGVASIDMTAEDIQVEEDDVPANPDEPPPAYVFTFDSLGGRHKAAGNRLGDYLHLEAHDKKGIERSNLSATRYMVAKVPTQPNSCDCGVYLLHFAKQFMQNAEDIVTYVTTKQARNKGKSAVPDEHWDPEAVTRAREDMRKTIDRMSSEWRVARYEENQRKEEERKAAEAERVAAAAAAGDGTAAGEGAEKAINIDDDSDDSDIQVLDAPSPQKGARKRNSASGSKAANGSRPKRKR